MKIAVDLDGVLYDWEGTARLMLRNWYGLSVPEALNIVSDSWDYIKRNVSEEAWDWLWTGGIAEGLFVNGNVIKNAISSVCRLAEKHDVQIVTSRPKSALHDTLSWCATHLRMAKISNVVLLPDGRKKTDVDFDLLIDDGSHNIKDALTARRSAILFVHPWNVHDALEFMRWGVRTAYDWGDVIKGVDNMETKGANNNPADYLIEG